MDPTGLQSVGRAISVLEMLARDGECGVNEVASALGVHKSSASRLLSTLVQRGVVEQDVARGKYRIGIGLLQLSSAVLGRLDVVRLSRPVLDDLAGSLGETVNLAVLRSHFAVNVEQARGTAAIAAQNWTGQLTPLHATSSGKVLLAHQSPSARTHLMAASRTPRFTRRTVVNRRALHKMLDSVVADGYATAFEEFEDGLNAVAAPVRDHTGRVVAAVSVSGPAFRLGAARIAEVAQVVVYAATRMSERMGHFA